MTGIALAPGTLKPDGRAVIVATTPYHPDFSERAKALGGTYLPLTKQWAFDPRDEQRVRDLLRSLFGTDGSAIDAANTGTLRIEFMRNMDNDAGFWFGGRCIAKAYGRDSGARLCEGTVVLQGGFGSGGSRANYRTTVKAGTIVEVRDLPLPAIEREIANAPAVCASCNGTGWLSVSCHRPGFLCDECREGEGSKLRACYFCEGTGAPEYRVSISDTPTLAEVAQVMGSGGVNAPSTAVEAAWQAILGLPIEGQVEIRNRLLAAI